jgi:isocitrate dehydrogenase
MTKDLAMIIYEKGLKPEHCLTTEGFLEALNINLQQKLK